MESLAVATVTVQNGSQLVVTRTGFDRFPNGTAVNFVDTTTGAEIDGATIVAQNPADSLGPGVGETVTLTLSQALPNITPGMRMVFADATMRGSGSTVEDNVVENLLFGRGVWIGGSRGVTIQRNVIRTTSSAAISLFEDTINDVGPPAHDIVIQDNRLESNLGPMASGSITQFALAAVVINTVVTDSFRFASGAVNSNISVINNTILDSGRGGIWMGETNGGTIANNRIVSWRQHPELPIFAVPEDLQPQVLEDITQPIVVRYSSGTSVQNNVVGCATFTDDPLVAGATTVKAVHLGELRTCVDAIRLHYGLSSYPYTDSSVTAATTVIKAQHLTELRTALSQAYSAANTSSPTYTDTIVSGQTPVRAVHVSELRTAIKALDSVLH
jgi:parallel beta-helix repeat protein